MNIKRVMVVEDQRMFREFLVGWLKKEGYVVAGEAADLAGAKALSGRVEVDLVLLDMDLPDGEGIEFVDWLSARRQATRVLVLTAHTANYPVVRLRRHGVMGVLDKGETCGMELRRAFAALAEWRSYYSERVERAFRQMVRESGSFYKTLSPREEELVKLFGRGLSNEEIAKQLELSVATVQGHRRNVMAKAGVKNSPELIIWSIQNGFVLGSEIGRMAPVAGRG